MISCITSLWLIFSNLYTSFLKTENVNIISIYYKIFPPLLELQWKVIKYANSNYYKSNIKFYIKVI